MFKVKVELSVEGLEETEDDRRERRRAWARLLPPYLELI
jgi:hypothetical protein